MKVCIIFGLLTFSTLGFSKFKNEFYLTEKEQTYFKNDDNSGNNTFERVNINVREINRLHGELAMLKAQVLELKKEMLELKKGK